MGDNQRFYLYPDRSCAFLFLINGKFILTDPRNTDIHFVQNLSDYMKYWKSMISNSNLEDSLSVIFKLFKSYINTMMDFIKNLLTHQENALYSFKTPLITDKQEVILVYTKIYSKSQTESSRISDIFLEILNFCNQNIQTQQVISTFLEKLINIIIEEESKNFSSKSINYEDKYTFNAFKRVEDSFDIFLEQFNRNNNLNISIDKTSTPEFYWFDLLFVINDQNLSFIDESNQLSCISKSIADSQNYKKEDLILFIKKVITKKVEKIPTNNRQSYLDYFNNKVTQMQFKISPFEEDENYNNTESADKYWNELINYRNFTNQADVLKTLESLFNHYKGDTTKKNQIKKAIWEFIKIVRHEDIILNSYLKDEFTKTINIIMTTKKIYYLKDLFSVLIENLLDKNLYSNQLLIIFNDDLEKKFKIGDTQGHIALYSKQKELYLNFDLNFYIKNTKNDLPDQERENEIFNKKCSKFVTYINEEAETMNYTPYFPMGSLESIIKNTNLNLNTKRNFSFDIVTKLVLILEILTGLKDLHGHGKFHGNLSDQSIFINSKIDAYIGSIAVNASNEGHMSVLRGPPFYRSPKRFKRDDRHIQTDLEQGINDDIYSASVLIHEILTDTNPIYRMSELSNEDRYKILRSYDYCKFLLDEHFNNECFNDQELAPFKELIINGMSEKCTFKSINDIIEEIQKFDIYKKYSEEINYRISRAADCCSDKDNKYFCHLSNLVESHLLGISINQDNIYSLFRTYKSFYNPIVEKEYPVLFNKSNDLINDIYNFFRINFIYQPNEFNDFFTKAIKRNFLNKYLLNNSITFDFDNKLLSLSKEINETYNLIPFCSLDSFINNNKELAKKSWKIWSYSLLLELLLIHGNIMFHGHISSKSIGIYYKKETEMFIPLIVPFYIVYNTTNEVNNQLNPNLSYQDNVSKKQKGDIKSVINIINNIEGYDNAYDDILDPKESLWLIVRNLKSKLSLDLNYEKLDYSKFQIEYTDIRKLLISNNINSSFNNNFFDFNDFRNK